MSVAVVVGSAFGTGTLGGHHLEAVVHPTKFGDAVLHRWPESDAWVLVRHGAPHSYLPHQIPFRAHTQALADVGCRALLLTSSAGVLDPDTPPFEPMLLGDLLMPENPPAQRRDVHHVAGPDGRSRPSSLGGGAVFAGAVRPGFRLDTPRRTPADLCVPVGPSNKDVSGESLVRLAWGTGQLHEYWARGGLGQ